ncbi:Uncharacterised protein [Segatella copri]|nr:Uncharacterised protein [Segatella copri]
MLVLVFILVFHLVLDGDVQITIVIDVYTNPLFLQARSCNLHDVILICLLDVNGRSSSIHT